MCVEDVSMYSLKDMSDEVFSKLLEDAKDCYKATDFAYGLYKVRGNFSAWSAYNNLSYKNHDEQIY